MRTIAVCLSVLAGLTVAASAAAITLPHDRLHQVRDRVQDINQHRQLRLDQTTDTRRQEFRAAVRDRLDARHQEIALRVANNLNTTNQNLTAAYLRHLEAMSNLLNRIQARTDNAVDVTSAQAAIEEAEGAVAIQAAKEYVVVLDDTKTIGQALRAAVQEMRADHRAVREVIRAVLESIRSIIQSL